MNECLNLTWIHVTVCRIAGGVVELEFSCTIELHIWWAKYFFNLSVCQKLIEVFVIFSLSKDLWKHNRWNRCSSAIQWTLQLDDPITVHELQYTLSCRTSQIGLLVKTFSYSVVVMIPITCVYMHPQRPRGNKKGWRERETSRKKIGIEDWEIERCPWGKSLTRPVSNSSLNTAFWFGRKVLYIPFVLFCPRETFFPRFRVSLNPTKVHIEAD